MTNLARTAVVTCAATLAGLIGAGAAQAVPLSEVGGSGTYVAGQADPAQMLPGTYETQGPVAKDVPCEWAIRTSDGGVRSEGKAFGATSIALVEGELLDTRNCQSWLRTSDSTDNTMAMIIAGAGLAGTGSALLGSSIAAVITASLVTGNSFMLAFVTGSAGGAATDFATGSAGGTDGASGSAGGTATELLTGSAGGSGSALLGLVVPTAP
ncbi:hypothetical protein OG921_07615 [Aldersonia sp. NBC_00410]|uniref:hypothetical protein n=1 Tax=Aldersonia sp. NBC_00410 TaxID=2975954 RepID=UPI00224E99B6|nr:hypothetical protein [Aldersonia sp. NBC_00410]MCX5043035.1 hypothetical protein [Aldersonia sp. NBC_00410]